jgi:hypothetical protein
MEYEITLLPDPERAESKVSHAWGLEACHAADGSVDTTCTDPLPPAAAIVALLRLKSTWAKHGPA